MGNLVLSGSTSGSITISPPSSAGSNTLTLPANTGTVITTGSTFGGTGPAFSAYESGNQSISSNVWTKVTLGTEEFDTNNNFASSRFTPTVAGYYQINGSINYATFSNGSVGIASIYKNGSEAKRGQQATGGGVANTQYIVSALVYLNGSSDYVELYTYQSTVGSVNTAGGASQVYFQASLVRAA